MRDDVDEAMAGHEIDWREAVRRVTWVPEAHRSADIGASAARRILRCSKASFAQLEAFGLPYQSGPKGPLYDRHDVQNVGLVSGTGLTEVEMGMRIVLGFMRADAAALVEPRRWQYELALRSTARPGARLVRRVYRPTPEIVGGSLESCSAEVSGPFVKVVDGGSATGTLVTRGAVRGIRSKEILRIAKDFFDSGIRWQYLPGTMVDDHSASLALGVGTCRTLSATLETLLVAAGFEARAYRGWMIALSHMGHGWVEVLDEDGSVKWLDPSFALLATDNGFGTPEFRDFVLGSVPNRVVPTRALGGSSLQADNSADDGIELRCRGVPFDRRSRLRLGAR